MKKIKIPNTPKDLFNPPSIWEDLFLNIEDIWEFIEVCESFRKSGKKEVLEKLEKEISDFKDFKRDLWKNLGFKNKRKQERILKTENFISDDWCDLGIRLRDKIRELKNENKRIS